MSNPWLGQSPSDLVRSLRTLADDLEKLAQGRAPTPPGGIVKIRDFVFSQRTVPCLVGRMSGHPHIREGSAGMSTELYYVNKQSGIVRSFNRFYRLVGEPI